MQISKPDWLSRPYWRTQDQDGKNRKREQVEGENASVQCVCSAIPRLFVARI